MIDSFSNNIKNILLDINNNDYSTIKDEYNKLYGNDGYDNLLTEINSIENDYMVNGNYEKDSLNKVTNKITKFYEQSINKEISNNNLDLREKESLLETFQSKMNNLVNSYNEEVIDNELQNKRKH